MPRRDLPHRVLDGHKRKLQGPEWTVLSDLPALIKSHDPRTDSQPSCCCLDSHNGPQGQTLQPGAGHQPTGFYKPMASKSYWSYGKVNHKEDTLIPEGRILIDTARSFVYAESGLKGILTASRLSGLSQNPTYPLHARHAHLQLRGLRSPSPGHGCAILRADTEAVRNISDLRASDKGGMMFQPEPGVYEKVHEIDFTSLYPSIIVKYNLSPETIERPELKGFLSTVLSSLLSLRTETKRLKKTNPNYAGIDSVLKWMLVTCFGYTGYRNAKFGQIEVHESITAISRELLLQIKDLAEGMNFQVLHGIVDCLWVIGEPIASIKEAVERETGILTEVDSYNWITFLPMADGSGAYNRYFGRQDTGKMKIRGVMARKGDTPESVRHMQKELFEVLTEAKSRRELRQIEPMAQEVRRKYLEELGDADVRELAIHRRVGRLNYSRRCAEASAVRAHIKQGISLAPGMEIGYVVKDAKRSEVEPERTAAEFDAEYYRKLLEKAWEEAAFVFQ